MTPSAPGRSLVEDAFHLLRAGPASAETVAAQVLRVSGNAPARVALVDALLGGDDRFCRDAAGRWRLAGPADAPGVRLERLRYAVVDVETTGGAYRDGHRITEVAVVEVSDGRIQDVWHTLVNPGRWIPRSVQALTGIAARDVGAAPFFEEIAEGLLERLEDRVFVGHNVRFDWGFVSAHLGDALGDVPRVPRLCTVRMARHLVPTLRRRSLDGLADHFGLPIHDRHRAHGDAWVTARILLRLLDAAGRSGLTDLTALERHLRRPRRERLA